MSSVDINPAAVAAFFRDIDGPVGVLMADLAERIASVARSAAPVRRIPDRYHTGRRSDARRPGYLASHITTTVGHAVTRGDVVFGGANAPEDPGLFLELPAEQIRNKGHKFPFLSTGLDSLWVG